MNAGNEALASSQSIDFLKKKVSRQIDRFNNRRTNMRRWRNGLYNSQILVSAITTVIIAANIEFGSALLNMIAAFGNVLATTFGVFLARYMFHERLATYTETSGRLQALLSSIQFLEAKNQDKPDQFPINPQVAEELFSRMQEILSSTHSEWMEMMKRNTPTNARNQVNENTND